MEGKNWPVEEERKGEECCRQKRILYKKPVKRESGSSEKQIF